MIQHLTDYYRLRRLPEFAENKTPRYDCIASTESYPHFELIAQRSRVKRFFFYYNGVPGTFSNHAKEKAERVITNTRNISSVFIPSLNKPHLGFGDVHGTLDALLFIFSSDYTEIELFVARGYKSNQKQLYNLLYDNELMDELNTLRSRAVPLQSTK